MLSALRPPRALRESFVQKLEELEDKFKCAPPAPALSLSRSADWWRSAAHAELEIALHKYNSVAGKEARKTERVAVDKKSLELERVQDLINQVRNRCCCERICLLHRCWMC